MKTVATGDATEEGVGGVEKQQAGCRDWLHAGEWVHVSNVII